MISRYCSQYMWKGDSKLISWMQIFICIWNKNTVKRDGELISSDAISLFSFASWYLWIQTWYLNPYVIFPNEMFSCPSSSEPTLGQWIVSDCQFKIWLWDLRHFRHLIRLMSGLKDKKMKIRKDQKDSLILWCFYIHIIYWTKLLAARINQCSVEMILKRFMI